MVDPLNILPSPVMLVIVRWLQSHVGFTFCEREDTWDILSSFFFLFFQHSHPPKKKSLANKKEFSKKKIINKKKKKKFLFDIKGLFDKKFLIMLFKCWENMCRWNKKKKKVLFDIKGSFVKKFLILLFKCCENMCGWKSVVEICVLLFK